MPKKIPDVSKLLKMAIRQYQFDVVGWTKYCTDNKNAKCKELTNSQSESLEILHTQNKISNKLNIPPIQKIYASKRNYINWLDKEYVRDQAFYETILKNPKKFKLDLEDDLINKEIDISAKKYLKTIGKRRDNEKSFIRDISKDEWDEIKISKYPKVLLGLILGASEKEIINNFGIYFINLVKAHFAGSRTAFLSSSGPEYWHELDKCKVELTYFKEEVLRPSLSVYEKKKKKK